MTSGAPARADVRVGLVGAGPWAELFHAPLLALSAGTELTGVWARRPEEAERIAAPYGARGFSGFDELLEQVDALAFAVPPDVQAELAVRGAEAGKALLLEKPLALDLGAARALADAVDGTGVPTQMVLTWRYADSVRRFVDACGTVEPLGGRGHFLTGGLLGGMFTTPWRLERGPLDDLGPHVLDLLGAALGPIAEVDARGDRHRWVELQLVHESGVISQASLTAYSRLDPGRSGVEVYTADGVIEVDTAEVGADAFTRIGVEFADTARGLPHPLDVHHGLRLQHDFTAAADRLDARA